MLPLHLTPSRHRACARHWNRESVLHRPFETTLGVTAPHCETMPMRWKSPDIIYLCGTNTTAWRDGGRILPSGGADGWVPVGGVGNSGMKSETRFVLAALTHRYTCPGCNLQIY